MWDRSSDNETRTGNYSIQVDDFDDDGFNETVIFSLKSYSTSFISEVLTINLLPEHILGDPINHGIQEDGRYNIREWIEHPVFWDGYHWQ